MAGPGIDLIGQEEIDEFVEVLRSRHLSRAAAKYLGVPASAV
jgi:hypothetical protein